MKHCITQAILVHPHPLECEAVAGWLQKRSTMSLVGKSSCLEKVMHIPYLREIDLVIAFAYSTEDTAGQILALRKVHPALKFLLLGPGSSMKLVKELIRSGVSGYIGIEAEIHEWEHAIKSVSEGKIYYGQEVMMRLSETPSEVTESQPAPTSRDFLSKREIEILRLVASEYSTNRIASELFISGKTVESHRRNLFQKLGVKNSVGLTKVAVRLGVV
ncbi:response regulator transcription factor [Dyadobacter aurulentus]|uniref:response regulator transcription factor n=1 Tax=Dyadobacter sp. UC 10 TaxID=2605428 RepID=UPI0011F1C11D|nr:response regulator transcription factor [Dyadobacter sp. UC 10]KAA0990170.1 response regulator transcription factor [Dyadobacter sp. UC 10]